MTPKHSVGDVVWVETTKQWGTVERVYEDGYVVTLPALVPKPLPWSKAVPKTLAIWINMHALWIWLAADRHSWWLWMNVVLSFLCVLLDVNTAFYRRGESYRRQQLRLEDDA
jgi:hypothetical protein